MRQEDSAILYIPVQAYDQYGNEYDAFTSNAGYEDSLTITINGEDSSKHTSLTANWYQNTDVTTSITLEANNTTKIGAIG